MENTYNTADHSVAAIARRTPAEVAAIANNNQRHHDYDCMLSLEAKSNNRRLSKKVRQQAAEEAVAIRLKLYPHASRVPTPVAKSYDTRDANGKFTRVSHDLNRPLVSEVQVNSSTNPETKIADKTPGKTHDDRMAIARCGMWKHLSGHLTNIPLAEQEMIVSQIVAMWDGSDALATTQVGLKIEHVLAAVQVLHDMSVGRRAKNQ